MRPGRESDASFLRGEEEKVSGSSSDRSDERDSLALRIQCCWRRHCARQIRSNLFFAYYVRETEKLEAQAQKQCEEGERLVRKKDLERSNEEKLYLLKEQLKEGHHAAIVLQRRWRYNRSLRVSQGEKKAWTQRPRARSLYLPRHSSSSRRQSFDSVSHKKTTVPAEKKPLDSANRLPNTGSLLRQKCVAPRRKYAFEEIPVKPLPDFFPEDGGRSRDDGDEIPEVLVGDTPENLFFPRSTYQLPLADFSVVVEALEDYDVVSMKYDIGSLLRESNIRMVEEMSKRSILQEEEDYLNELIDSLLAKISSRHQSRGKNGSK